MAFSTSEFGYFKLAERKEKYRISLFDSKQITRALFRAIYIDFYKVSHTQANTDISHTHTSQPIESYTSH